MLLPSLYRVPRDSFHYAHLHPKAIGALTTYHCCSDHLTFVVFQRADDVRPGSANSIDIDENEAKNWKIAIIARDDVISSPATLAMEASVTVLQHFKKLYKRRDPALKMWEAGRHRMEFRSARTDDVLAAVQSAARGSLIATHTCSGRVPGVGNGRNGRDRRLMVIGPTESSRLHEIVGRLEEL